jgi:hypothetical protein
MIGLANGWAQWDWSLKTYRAQVDDVVYGNSTDDVATLEALEVILAAHSISLSEQDRTDLLAEKETDELNNAEPITE